MKAADLGLHPAAFNLCPGAAKDENKVEEPGHDSCHIGRRRGGLQTARSVNPGGPNELSRS